MEYSEFILWKAGGLIVIAFVGNFLYAFLTGHSLTEGRSDTPQEPTNREGRES